MELLVEVDHNQLRTMASETVDRIDLSQPPPPHGPQDLLQQSELEHASTGMPDHSGYKIIRHPTMHDIDHDQVEAYSHTRDQVEAYIHMYGQVEANRHSRVLSRLTFTRRIRLGLTFISWVRSKIKITRMIRSRLPVTCKIRSRLTVTRRVRSRINKRTE